MSKGIDNIKRYKVKQSLLNGNTAKQALIEAGYSLNTATHSTSESVIKVSQAEIIQELKQSEVTVEVVLQRLNEDRNLAQAKGDIATMTRVDELLGRYLAMFTDKQQIKGEIITEQEQGILQKYISSNRIQDLTKLT